MATLVATQSVKTPAANLNLNNATVQTWQAARWVATEAFNLEQVVWSLWRSGSPSGNVWVEVYDESAGVPNAVIANGTSSTINALGLGTESLGTNQVFSFSTPPNLTNGAAYYFVLKSSYTLSTTDLVHIACNTSAVAGWELWKYTPWTEFASPVPFIEIYKTDVPMANYMILRM